MPNNTSNATVPAETQDASIKPTTNVLAIVSLASAVGGYLTAGLGWIAGIVTGHIALSQIKARGEAGRGLALAGLITSYVSIGLSIVMLILASLFFVALIPVFLAAIAMLSEYGYIDWTELQYYMDSYNYNS